MKRILVVTPFFAPENSIASVRFTKISKYLHQMGYHVTVICCENMGTDKKDKILADDSEEVDKIYRLPMISIHKKLEKIYINLRKSNEVKEKKKNVNEVAAEKKSIFSKVVSGKIYQIFAEEWSYLMDVALGRNFIRFVKKNKREFQNFDCVISTYGPMSSHILGKYMRKKGLCRKWIADYRDVIYDTLRAENVVIRKKKKNIADVCLHADYVTAVTDNMVTRLDEYCKRFRKKSIAGKAVCISNGFDEADIRYLDTIPAENELSFCYCGVIYYNEEKVLRNPRPLFQAIRELVTEQKIDENRIKFHYAGKDYEVFSKFAKEYGLEKNVINHGFVERIKSLNIQRGSDVILSLSWNTKTDKGIMTGKIYEAFLVKRNVLCLIAGDEPNSDLKKMIEINGAGFTWEEGNHDKVEDIKKWVLQVYEEKMNVGEVAYNGNMEEIRKYSHQYLTGQFVKLIEK